jgi:HAD superfamily hydrolase (TIGR01484 family)
MSQTNVTGSSLPVVCFDLDGTLLNDSGQIHPQDMALLKAEPPPAHWVPTTGRPLSSVKKMFGRLGLLKDGWLPFPAVLQNGAVVLGWGEQPLAHTAFSAEAQSALIEIAERFPEIDCMLLGQAEIYIANATPFGWEAAVRYDFSMRPLEEEHRLVPFSKVMWLAPERAQLEPLEALVRRLPVEGAYSMDTIFEVSPRGVHKAAGLHTLLAKMGWEQVPVLFAGDGENDAELLRSADLSFAPVDSPPQIQALAGRVIDPREAGLLQPMLEALKT